MATKKKVTGKKSATKKSAEKKTAIQKSGPSALSTTERPDFVTGDNEDRLESDELMLPRIEVAQAMSPQLDEDDASYIEGLKVGTLFNTATGEMYGRELSFVAVVYRKEYLLFQDRDMGGGFGGTFDSHEAAERAAQNLEGEGWEPMLALSNLIYILNPDGSIKEMAYLSCTKTKIKVAKRMNTYLQMVNAPRYASVFALGSVKEDGAKGTYYNFAINPTGWVGDRDTFEKARELAESMKGKAIMSQKKKPESEEKGEF